MRRAGFTLVEILVVLTIMGTLLAIGSLQFNSYFAKNAIERQTRELYAEFMTARVAAVTQHASKTVIVTPTKVTFNASGPGGSTVTKTLSKPITWAGIGTETEKVITFDERGLSFGSNNTTICVEPSVENAQVDSIVLFTTRIRMGKIKFEEVCSSAEFTAK